MNLRINKKIILTFFVVTLSVMSFVSVITVNAQNNINPSFLQEPTEEQIMKPIESVIVEQQNEQKESSGFVPLEQGFFDALSKDAKGDVSKDASLFFNAVFTFGIYIAGFLATIMIAIGGIQYMSTDAVDGKSEGRERITYAIMGLLLVLFSWILLNQINPDLLNLTI